MSGYTPCPHVVVEVRPTGPLIQSTHSSGASSTVLEQSLLSNMDARSDDEVSDQELDPQQNSKFHVRTIPRLRTHPKELRHGAKRLLTQSTQGYSHGQQYTQSHRYDHRCEANTAAKVERWYFKLVDDNEVQPGQEIGCISDATIAAKPIEFRCTTVFNADLEVSPPVLLGTSTCDINWHRVNYQVQMEEPMEVILGLSLDTVFHDKDTEQLVVTVNTATTYSRGDTTPCIQTEVIPYEQLSKMIGGEVRLKLHMRTDFPSTMNLEFQTKSKSPRVNGFLTLHYVELMKKSTTLDYSLSHHRPYIWSHDVGNRQDYAGSVDRLCTFHHQDVDIIKAYSFSGDGCYLVTLSAGAPHKSPYIQLWNLGPIEDDCSGDQATNKTPMPIQKEALAVLELHANDGAVYPNCWSLSLSYNGSQVAVTSSYLIQEAPASSAIDLTVKEHNRQMRTSIYNYVPTESNKFVSSTNDVTGGKAEFKGHGQFFIKARKDLKGKEDTYYDLLRSLYGLKRRAHSHIQHIKRSKHQKMKDELFIALEHGQGLGIITIFSVYKSWEMLWKIADPQANPGSHSIQGRRLAYLNEDGDVSVWNMESRRFVSRFKTGDPKNQSIVLARNATLVVVANESSVTSYCSESGSQLASYKALSIGSISAEATEHGYLLISNAEEKDMTGAQLTISILVDPVDMSVKQTFHTLPDLRIAPPRAETLPSVLPGENSEAFSVHGSRLDRVGLYDRIVETPCSENCLEHSLDTVSTVENSDGLMFTVDGRKLRITTAQDSVGRTIELPKFPNAPCRLQISRTFLRLVMVAGHLIIVWTLPETMIDDLTLQGMWCENAFSWTGTVFKECAHGHPYLGDRFTTRLRKENAFTMETADAFFRAIPYLVTLFHSNENVEFYDDCLRFFGQYINTFPYSPEKSADNSERSPESSEKSRGLFDQFCWAWTDPDRILYEKFLDAFLTSPHCHWVPLMKYRSKDNRLSPENPLSVILERSKNSPRITGLFRIITKYCFDQVVQKYDLRFLSPITFCLWDVFDPKHPYEELTSMILRRSAFIPVKGFRNFIIDNHVVSGSPDLRELVFRKKAQPSHQNVGAVFQLERHWKSEPDVNKESFTKDIYVATFGMLWHDRGSPSEPTESCHPAGQLPLIWYWIKVIPFILVYTINPFSQTIVTCHRFALEDLDHPAIYALIKYKWNRLGFMFWFVRFFYQCLYYILVLLAVFMQVYSHEHFALTWVFILISVFAIGFLCLEVIQLFHNPRRYFDNLVYNIVDVIVFALPLGGSINHFLRNPYPNDPDVYPRGPNSWFLSYSVVFIALHLLFELRVNKSVCQFVTIFVRIFGQIRIFFVIFIAGTLAFTTALLHLLRGCVRGPCATPITLFPGQYYEALVTTSFFMTGQYNLIQAEFSSDNYAFYTLMIIYLFFTVIVMLNVLIAIINDGYSKGDTTWHLVWLQNQLANIEAVENLSFYLPGLREHYDLFPKEIYYSATPASKKAMENKWILREKEGALKVGQSLQGYKKKSRGGKMTNATLAADQSNQAYALRSGDVLGNEQRGGQHSQQNSGDTLNSSLMSPDSALSPQPQNWSHPSKTRHQSVQRLRERASKTSLRLQEAVAGIPIGTLSSPFLEGGIGARSHESAGGMEERVKAIVNERLDVTENTVRELKAQLDVITQMLARMEKGKQSVSSSFD